MNAHTASWQLSRLDQAAPVPWRNGGGITHELAAWPDLGAWRWRISVAEVARDGPFSRFDGIDRHFAVLSGAGVCLSFADRTVTLTAQDPVFSFAGDAACDCRLLAGPTLDFNLMCQGLQARLERFTRTVWHLQAKPGDTVGFYAIEPAQLHAADAHLTVPAHTLCWAQLPHPTQVAVTGDSFLGWTLTATHPS